MPAAIDPKIRAQVLAYIESTGCTAREASKLYEVPASTISTWLRRDPLATVDEGGDHETIEDEDGIETLPPMSIVEYADLDRVDFLRRKIAEAERAVRVATTGRASNWTAWTQITKVQMEMHDELHRAIQARGEHDGLDDGPDAIARELLVAADLLRAMGGPDLIPPEARPREAVDARSLLAELGLDPDAGPTDAPIERAEVEEAPRSAQDVSDADE